MPSNKEKNGKSGSLRKLLLLGCALPLGVLALASLLLAAYLMFGGGSGEPPEYIESNEPEVAKRLEEIDRRAEKAGQRYDIDQTIMALFSIEKALNEAKTFEDLTPFILRKDSDMVAPDAARLKYRFFNVYKKILDARDDSEEAKSMYDAMADAVKSVASVIGYNPATGISFD